MGTHEELREVIDQAIDALTGLANNIDNDLIDAVIYCGDRLYLIDQAIECELGDGHDGPHTRTTIHHEIPRSAGRPSGVAYSLQHSWQS